MKSGPDRDQAVLRPHVGHGGQQREIGFLAQRQHQRVGPQLLELAGGLREARLVELHPLNGQQSPLVADDGREPLEAHPFVDRVRDLFDGWRASAPVVRR